MTRTPKLALTLGDDDIIIDYTPNEIEGVTVQEILDKVKEKILTTSPLIRTRTLVRST